MKSGNKENDCWTKIRIEPPLQTDTLYKTLLVDLSNLHVYFFE